ncbi:MAG: sensor histidine kinase, partial [Actinomycetota bacterium]|nr:sensor histidine kinase [Actinomycetota bacterium]
PPAAGAGAPVDPRQAHDGGRRKTVVPCALGLVSALLVAGGFSLGVYMPNLHNGLIAAAFTAVGVFVVLRRPGNREGWLFIATGVAHAVMFAGRQYGFYAGTHEGDTLPAVSWVTWMGVWPLPLVLVLSGVTIMCFPNGRLPSPRWRKVVAAMVSVGALLALASALWPVEYAENSLSVPHPLHVAGYATAQGLWTMVAPPVYLSFQMAWAACVVVRLRRAEGDEARQLKWFVYTVAMAVVAMAVSLIVFRSAALGVLAVPVVPIAAGAAILKYRLYDIDVVINKTIVFALLAGFIAVVYVALVVGVGTLVGGRGEANLGLSVAATAVVAVAFDPARRRVQGWANRLVYGQRATPYEVLSSFSARMGETLATEELLDRMARLLAEGTGARAQVWLRMGESLRPAAAWPSTEPAQHAALALNDGALPHIEGAHRVVPVVHRGELLGALTVTKPRGETVSSSEDKLVADMAAQAGLVLRNVRLTAELLDHVEELRASRQRLVTAQDDERRRLERDLHDGAQQQLVSIKINLSLAKTMAAEDEHAPQTASVITQVMADTDEAVQTLRELAHGIYPPLLASDGLKAALSARLAKAPLSVVIEADGLGRYPQEVEAAAYFCCLEAVQNVVKYAGASTARVHLDERDGTLFFTVEDDGRGFDPSATPRGAGLQNMVDRLDALGGRLQVISESGAGTTVCGQVPVRRGQGATSSAEPGTTSS